MADAVKVESAARAAATLIPAPIWLKQEGLFEKHTKITSDRATRGRDWRTRCRPLRNFRCHVEGCTSQETQIYEYLDELHCKAFLKMTRIYLLLKWTEISCFFIFRGLSNFNNRNLHCARCSLKCEYITARKPHSSQFQSSRAGSHINLIICTHRKNPEQEVSQTSAEVVQFLRYVLAVLSPEIVLFEQNASLRFQGMPFTDRSYLRNYRRRSRL